MVADVTAAQLGAAADELALFGSQLAAHVRAVGRVGDALGTFESQLRSSWVGARADRFLEDSSRHAAVVRRITSAVSPVDANVRWLERDARQLAHDLQRIETEIDHAHSLMRDLAPDWLEIAVGGREAFDAAQAKARNLSARREDVWRDWQAACGRFIGLLSSAIESMPVVEQGLFPWWPFAGGRDEWSLIVDLNDPLAADGHQFELKNYLGGELFPSGTGPAVRDVEQGGLGDCWLMAALAAVANSAEGRSRIKSMITENNDGSYTVKFADGEVLVDLDLYAKDGNPAYSRGNGNWVQIIEKALAARSHDEGFESLVGGYASDAFKALGYPVSEFTIDITLWPDPSEDEVESKIRSALVDGRPITASSPDHAWTVTSIDDDGYVTVRNPWGSADLESVKSKLFSEMDNSGYMADHIGDLDRGGGYFRIPIGEFVEAFDTLTIVSK